MDAVHGAGCASGHVNAAGRVYCLNCGAELRARTGPPTTGPRPVVGALVRADGVRHEVFTEFTLDGCSLPVFAGDFGVERSGRSIRARILFLGWEPHALAQTPGVGFFAADGRAQPLDLGESVALAGVARLVLGPDVYFWEPVGSAATTPAPSRRRRRLPDRTLFI